MFLDCDSVLFNRTFDDDSREWASSQLNEELNGSFFNTSFNLLEQGVIAESYIGSHRLVVGTAPGNVDDQVDRAYKYSEDLSGDRIFLLDVEEASNVGYGYTYENSPSTTSIYNSRIKSGTNSIWWLRSHDYFVQQVALVWGDTELNGMFSQKPYNETFGVSPALNIDQESILLSTAVNGTIGELGTEYTLTIEDPDLVISVPEDQSAQIADNGAVSIPYQILGDHAGNATRVSVIITDDEENIIYYDALGGIFPNNAQERGTLTLPDGLSIEGWGDEYHVFIFAEDINGIHETDYASIATEVVSPITHSVTYSVVNGTWEDGTVEEVTEDVPNGAYPSNVPTGMVADPGYEGGTWSPALGQITEDTLFTYTFTLIPTVTPDPTVTSEPTLEPEPTEIPEPTAVPEPTTMPEPSVTTEPEIEPESEVAPDPTAIPDTDDDTGHALTPEQIRQSVVNHFTEDLYLVILGRPYDVEGRDNWRNRILNYGDSGSAIVYGFLNSEEFLAKNLNDEEYITLLYRIFFNREPDTQGLENWKSALANGATRNEIIQGFAGSQEWLMHCARYLVNP